MAFTGKIVKGIAGFYYVDTGSEQQGLQAGVYACRAKGIFREQHVKPLPGDDVTFEVTDVQDMEGNITEVKPRTNEMFRPEVANVDQALVVFAVRQPDPNFLLLDRFLVTMRQMDLPVILCFNKQDIAPEDAVSELQKTYADSGCEVRIISAQEETGVEMLAANLYGKTTVLAGPSGVGKSTLLNFFTPSAQMEVGTLSKKIGRGKNTTRHTQLVRIERGVTGEAPSYLIDTPGFTALQLRDIKPQELCGYYPEFLPLVDGCKYGSCVHIAEPACAVKEAVEEGRIAARRYESYRVLYEELSGTRPVYEKRKKQPQQKKE